MIEREVLDFLKVHEEVRGIIDRETNEGRCITKKLIMEEKKIDEAEFERHMSLFLLHGYVKKFKDDVYCRRKALERHLI